MNGINLGNRLHSRKTSTEMIEHIANSMRSKIGAQIKELFGKIPYVYVDDQLLNLTSPH